MVKKYVWLAHLGVAYDKSRMGGYRDVCYSWNTIAIPYSNHHWISKIGKQGGQEIMELLNLFLICFGIFGFFSIIEVVKLKKEVKKLNGIVEHLLKNKIS